MAKFFGYDDGNARRWINLDYVIHVLADRGKSKHNYLSSRAAS